MAKVTERTATELFGEAPSWGSNQGSAGRIGPDVNGKESEVESMGGAEAPSRDFDLKDAGREDDSRDSALSYGKPSHAPRIT